MTCHGDSCEPAAAGIWVAGMSTAAAACDVIGGSFRCLLFGVGAVGLNLDVSVAAGTSVSTHEPTWLSWRY